MGEGGRLTVWAERAGRGVESQICHSPPRKALTSSELRFVHP